MTAIYIDMDYVIPEEHAHSTAHKHDAALRICRTFACFPRDEIRGLFLNADNFQLKLGTEWISMGVQGVYPTALSEKGAIIVDPQFVDDLCFHDVDVDVTWELREYNGAWIRRENHRPTRRAP